MSDTLRPFLRMIRHVPPKQLAYRARLMAKRSLEDRFSRRFRAQLRRRVGSARVRDSLPVPVIAVRGPAVRVDADGLCFRAMGEEWQFTFPVDWTVAAQDPRLQSWRMELHQQLWLDQLDTASIDRVVSDWVARNPPFEPASWRDGWNSNVISIRVITWLDILARRPDLPADLRCTMAHSLVEQLLFLEAHLEQDIGGNHFLRNVRALMWAGHCIDSPHSERWSAVGLRFLQDEVDRQFLPDHLHIERCGCYHLLAAMDVITCWQLLDPGPVREGLSERIDGIVQVLRDITHPDGMPMQFNDSVHRVSVTSAEVVQAWEALCGRVGVAREVFDLGDAGYTGLRLADDYIVWDCGRIAPDELPGHGHGDCLAFEWSVGDQRVFVDTGVYEYVAGARRERSRATAAHNTVTLDDQDQCEFFSAFRVGRRLNIVHRDVRVHDLGFTGQGAHDGYRYMPGSPVHHRTFTATRGTVVIEDRVEGGQGQQATARLLVHPDARVEVDGVNAVVRVGDVCISVTASVPIHTQSAPWYPDLGVEHQTVQLVFHYGPAPVNGRIELVRQMAGV